MDEIIAKERALIMKALMEAGMMQSSPFGMTQNHQPVSVGSYGMSQVYDASDRYDSSLLQQIFLRTYNKKQKAIENRTVKLDESKVPPRRPGIEHHIAPSSLEVLKRVCVSDLLKKVNQIHPDCVLLVEVIHVPYRQDFGTMVLVKDSNNDIMMVDLYNYVAPEEDPKASFPVGKKFALLCPFLIFGTSQDCPQLHHLMLRCDNPQFVISCDDNRYIWKNPGFCKSPNPSELRLMGNQHFQEGNLEEACTCYSKALAHSDIEGETFASDKVSCLSNRAEVNLRLERWDEAVNDAEEVLGIQADHTKAKFRLAKALSRMGKASDALVLLKQLQRNGAGLGRSLELQELASDCRRIAKEERGKYDIKSMMKEASELPSDERLSSFHGTFCSPKAAMGVPISIPSSGGKTYRGCKALSNFKEGELIMSSRAFVISLNASEKWALREVESLIARKLWKTPSLGKTIYSLSDGGDPSRHDGGNDVDKIDLKRIRVILRDNTFSLTPYDAGIRQAWKRYQDDPQICFGGPISDPGVGLWLNESLLNHSCTPNCTWSNIRDQIFIHATKPIQEGEELCICYFPFSESYEKRFEGFSRWIQPGVGFDCVCDHCNLLRNRTDLRELANEVFERRGKVEDIARSGHIPRGVAAKEKFPSSRRQEILDAFSHLPPRLQHTRIAELHELEASILGEEDDCSGALKANQVAAKINFEVRGSGHWNYFDETWRIAGLAIVCGNPCLAHMLLEKIWKSGAFQAYPKEEAEVMFKDLTNKYATRQIPLDRQYLIQIQALVWGILNDLPHASHDLRRAS